MFREEQKQDKSFFISPHVYIDASTLEGGGMGCFTSKDIPARTIIESAPVILCHPETFSSLNQLHGTRHILSDYPFLWAKSGLSAFSLGWGGMYNHSFDPNVYWKFRTEKDDGYNALVFLTRRDVVAGEELFIRYINDADKLWFVDETVDPLATTKYKTDRQMTSMAKSSVGMMYTGDLKTKLKKIEKRKSIANTLGSLSTLGKKIDD